MNQRYLEITYRNGKAFAAYLYLPRRQGDGSARTERRSHGIVVDFSADGRPIGIEITSPSSLRLDSLNEVLRSLNVEPVTAPEIAPLAAA